MARKINVKLIMELRDAGLSRSTIASTRHISRHSVSEVFNIADAKELSYNDVRDLEGYLSYISFHFKNTIFKIIFKTYESKQIFTSFSSSRAKK